MKSPIFLDSSCFIYLLERNPKYHDFVRPIFTMLSSDKISAFSSIITVTEVLTKPFKENDHGLIKSCLEAFAEIPNLEILNPNYQTAIQAAKIRADLNLRLPDAYQLAMAHESKCKTFLTNDKELKKFKGFEVLVLDDLVSK